MFRFMVLLWVCVGGCGLCCFLSFRNNVKEEVDLMSVIYRYWNVYNGKIYFLFE